MKKITGALGVLCLTSAMLVAPAFGTVQAAPKARITPTLDALIVSEAGVNPYHLANAHLRTISFIRYSLPAGWSNFYTFVNVSGIPGGTHALRIDLMNPQGKVDGHTQAKFNMKKTVNTEILTTHWTHTYLGRGYNTFKVYLDGKYIGHTLFFGN